MTSLHLPKTALALLAAAALAACSSTPLEENKAPVENRTGSGVPGAGGSTAGAPQSRVTPVDIAKTDNAMLSNLPRVVYFDFDQDALKPEFTAIINCHAKYLRDRPSARITLEGNADERGSREYNHALGERRGNAVASALASGSQVNVVSYGEERPVCTSSTESCWGQNRRVEIVYTAK